MRERVQKREAMVEHWIIISEAILETKKKRRKKRKNKKVKNNNKKQHPHTPTQMQEAREKERGEVYVPIVYVFSVINATPPHPLNKK